MADLDRPNVFKLRIGRKHYWIAVAALLGIGIGLGVLFPNASSSALLIPWLLVYAWRLHDFGRSGWWAVLMSVGVVVLAVAGAILGYDAYIHYLEGAGAPPKTEAFALLVILAGGALALNLGFTVWLGMKPGDPGENRYGLPFGVKRPAREPSDFS